MTLVLTQPPTQQFFFKSQHNFGAMTVEIHPSGNSLLSLSTPSSILSVSISTFSCLSYVFRRPFKKHLKNQ